MPFIPSPSPQDLDYALRTWLEDKVALNQRPNTVRNSSLAFAAWLDFLASMSLPDGGRDRPAHLWDADSSLVRAWQASMREASLRPTTINHALACVSSFYEVALSSGLAPQGFKVNPFRANVRRERVDDVAALPLTPAYYAQLLSHLESGSSSLTGARAHALIRTLLHTGWRPGVLLAMRWGDLRPALGTSDAMLFTWTSPAGAKHADLLPSECWAALRHYLCLAGHNLNHIAPGTSLWTPHSRA